MTRYHACTVCSLTYKSKQDLRVHTLTRHPKQKTPRLHVAAATDAYLEAKVKAEALAKDIAELVLEGDARQERNWAEVGDLRRTIELLQDIKNFLQSR